MFKWYEMSIFGEFVNDHQDCIKGLRLGQSLNKVHADCVPCLVRYWKWL
jgi:hypothetical protein